MNVRSTAIAAAIALVGVAVAAPVPSSGAAPETDPPGIVWWALGDSYSSGEGLRYNDFGANPPGTNCERATGRSSVGTGSRAYSVVARDDLAGVEEFRLVACTGAITNQWREQWMETGGRRADLITLSFGGNNVGFADVIKGCAGMSIDGGINAVVGGAGSWLLNPALGCREPRAELDRRVDMLVGNGPDSNTAFDNSQTLPDMYAEIAAEAMNGGGHVFVLGYPNLVEESARWTWRLLSGNRCHRVRRADAAMLRGATGYLNQQIALAVERANDNPHGVTFHFLDVSEVYESETGRHGLCTGQPWLNGLTLGTAGPDDGPVPVRAYRSFHPNQLGHDATASVLEQRIRRLDWARLDDPGPPSDPEPPIDAPAATAGELVITPAAAGGRSEYPTGYSATITAITPRAGFLVDVGFTAIGRSDLRRPETVCLENDNGRVATPIAQNLTVDTPGEFRGTWTFPLIDSGNWSLRYSCQVDYTLAPVAAATVTAVGVSSFSAQYYATVLSSARAADGTVEIRFVSHGNERSQAALRDPATSCVIADGRAIAVTSVSLVDEVPGEFYEGTLRFVGVPDVQLQFLYSCQNDYSLVAL